MPAVFSKGVIHVRSFLYETAVTMLWERLSSEWRVAIIWWRDLILGRIQIKFRPSLPKTQSQMIYAYPMGHSLIKVTTLRFLPRVVRQLKLLPRVDTIWALTSHFWCSRANIKPHFNDPSGNKWKIIKIGANKKFQNLPKKSVSPSL